MISKTQRKIHSDMQFYLKNISKITGFISLKKVLYIQLKKLNLFTFRAIQINKFWHLKKLSIVKNETRASKCFEHVS